MLVVLNDHSLLSDLPDDAETAAQVAKIEDGSRLYNYPHPLPSLTLIGSAAYLHGYPHPLPFLTMIGGATYLSGYTHPLPALTIIEGSAELRGYEYQLPRLMKIGGWANLRGYKHPLPSLSIIEGEASLYGCCHLPDWIGYVGDDSSGLSFWADLTRRKVRASHHNFSPFQARMYWSPYSRTANLERLELAEKAIALINRTKLDPIIIGYQPKKTTEFHYTSPLRPPSGGSNVKET